MAQQQALTNHLLSCLNDNMVTVVDQLTMVCDKLEGLETLDPVKESTAQQMLQVLGEARTAQTENILHTAPIEVNVVVSGIGLLGNKGMQHGREAVVQATLALNHSKKL